MTSSPAVRAGILAALAVACQVVIFPPFGWSCLAWVAPLPLFYLSASGIGMGFGVLVCWVVGTLQATAVIAPWLWPAMRDVLPYSLATTLALLALLCQLVGGLPYALLGLVLAAGRRLRPTSRVLFAPAAWVGMEYLRAHLPFGTPWALLGASLAETTLAVQVADLGGVYAVSFVAALASAGIRELGPSTEPTQRTFMWRAPLIAAVLIAAALVYGAHRRTAIQTLARDAPHVRVALVHADVASGSGQDLAAAVAALERYLELSPDGGMPLDLVVWPENAVPLLLDENPSLVARIAARATSSSYLVGAPRAVAGDDEGALRASVFLVGAEGIEARYDKRRLLPFAETLPSLGGEGLSRARGFAPGAGSPILTTDGFGLGPLICYEAVFPETARAAVHAGAALLVNVSNDAWFSHPAGAAQHYLFSRIRAIELRRTLVRVANRGVTAVVLPDGSAPVATDGRTAGVEIAAVPLLDVRTPYARLGDVFAWTCLAGVGSGLLWSRRRGAWRAGPES